MKNYLMGMPVFREKNIKNPQFLSYLIVFSLIVFPILINDHALWDGTMLVNAIDLDDFELVKGMFYETGSYVVIFPHYLVYFTAHILNVGSHPVYAVYIGLSIFFIYFYIVKTIEIVFERKCKNHVLYSLMYSSLPIWSIFKSEIMINYAIPILFTIISVFLLFNRRYVLSFFSLFFCFDLQISLLMHIFIFSIFIIMNINVLDKIVNKKEIFIFYIVIFISFSFYTAYTPSHGAYENYNVIDISRLFTFFTDLNLMFKFVFFIPIIIIFSLSSKRFNYFLCFTLCVGMIGAFYLGGKINYFGYPTVYPWFARFDIPFYICLFILSGIYLFDEENKSLQLVFSLVFVVSLFPNRWILSESLNNNLDKIDAIYSSSFSLDEDKSYSVNVGGGAFFEMNYHLKKHYPDREVVSSDSFMYDKEYCGDSVYSKLYMCQFTDDNYININL